MGKIFQSRRWVVVAACCAVAALLNLGLTKFDTRFRITYCDYHTELKSGPATDPILTPGAGIADTMCIGQMDASEKAHQPAAFLTERGLFARSFISRILALSLGVVVPALLVTSAAFVTLKNGRSMSRTLAIVTFGAFGSLALGLWIFGIAMDSYIPLRDLINYSLPLVIPAAFFSGAYWLSRRPPPKERT